MPDPNAKVPEEIEQLREEIERQRGNAAGGGASEETVPVRRVAIVQALERIQCAERDAYASERVLRIVEGMLDLHRSPAPRGEGMMHDTLISELNTASLGPALQPEPEPGE